MHLRDIIERVPFPELKLTDDDRLRQWAATALFASELPTADIPSAVDQLQIRPLVRATVWSLTERERDGLLISEYAAYPEQAAARMAACVAAVADAPSWILLTHWQVAK